MTVISNPLLLKKKAAAGGGDSAYQIEKSLRFNRADSAWLKKIDKTGNRRQWTWSGWIKKTDITNSQTLFSGTVGTGSQVAGSLEIRILSGTQLYIAFCESNGSTVQWSAEGKAYYRDPSAWQHWVIVLDTPNAIANERCRVYVNGKKVEDWGTRNTITQNFEYGINKDGAYHLIGVHYSGENLQEHFDGYFSNVEFIDGLCLSPAAFGSFDSTGAWNPKTFALPAPNANTTWSGMLTCAAGFGTGVRAKEYAMNGNVSPNDFAASASNNSGKTNAIVFTPTGGLVVNQSIEIYGRDATSETMQCEVDMGNGYLQAVSGTSGSWITVFEGSGTLTKLQVWHSAGNSGENELAGVRVDGVILVDGQTDPTTRNNPNNGTTWSSSLALS